MREKEDNERYHSVALVLGMPRSGTTLLHRILTRHSKVDGAIEPYQSRRAQSYEEVEERKFLTDLNLRPDRHRCLVIKETSTRSANFLLSMKLLESFKKNGSYTGTILILRSPFEAFLSQVEASRTLWPDKRMTEVSPENFAHFARATIASFKEYLSSFRAHRYRVVTYKALCAEPEVEVSRLLAMMPLRFESGQLKLEVAAARGGDPKAYTKVSIEYSERREEAAKLRALITNSPYLSLMDQLDALSAHVGKEKDSEIIEELQRVFFKVGV